MNKLAVSVLILGVVLLSACSHHEPITPTESSGATNANSAEASGQSSSSELQQPDTSTPDSAYEDMTTKDQYTFQWVARVGGPVDYKLLSVNIQPTIGGISDTFKQQDAINAMKPKIDAGLAIAKTHPYIIMHGRIAIKDYDMATKSFPLQIISLPTFGYQEGPDVQFQVSNAADKSFQSLSLSDEQAARQLESDISQNYDQHRVADAKVYAFIQGASGSGGGILSNDSRTGLPTLTLHVVKIVLDAPNGQQYTLK